MKIRRIDFSPDEFIAGITALMRPEDLGVYWLICSLIYSRGEAIDDDPEWLAGIFKKTNPRTVRAALDRLVALEKVQQSDGQLMVNRCRIELEASANRVRTAAENGAKGGRPSKYSSGLTKPAGLSAQKLTTNHQPSTINGKERTPNGVTKKDAPQGGAGRPPTTRGARLGRDWKPTPADSAYATDRGLDPISVAEAFRDYWTAATGQNATKLDWSATWRTWCRKESERKGRAGGYGRAPDLSRVAAVNQGAETVIAAIRRQDGRAAHAAADVQPEPEIFDLQGNRL